MPKVIGVHPIHPNRWARAFDNVTQNATAARQRLDSFCSQQLRDGMEPSELAALLEYAGLQVRGLRPAAPDTCYCDLEELIRASGLGAARVRTTFGPWHTSYCDWWSASVVEE